MDATSARLVAVRKAIGGRWSMTRAEMPVPDQQATCRGRTAISRAYRRAAASPRAHGAGKRPFSRQPATDGPKSGRVDPRPCMEGDRPARAGAPARAARRVPRGRTPTSG
jgi:hypothetical protein